MAKEEKEELSSEAEIFKKTRMEKLGTENTKRKQNTTFRIIVWQKEEKKNV